MKESAPAEAWSDSRRTRTASLQEPLQISASLHAQPRPLWHVFDAWMQPLPQALPAEHTRQHLSAMMHAPPLASPGPASFALETSGTKIIVETTTTTDARL